MSSGQAAVVPSPVPGSVPPPVYGSVAPRAPSEPRPERSPAASFARTTPRAQAAVRPALSQERRAVDDASLGMSLVGKRPIGWIVVILVIDLALAATGAVLLAKGLGGKSTPGATSQTTGSAEPAPAPPAPAAATPAPAPPPTQVAAAAPAEPITAPANGSAEPAAPPATGSATAAKTDKHHHHPATPAKPAIGPQDPYAHPLDNEVDLQATRAQGAFKRCADAAAAHGKIQIAFQVTTEGRTTHIASVEDSTGSPTLAPCLMDIIARWSFAVHPSVTTDFVRPFTYP